MLVALVCFEQMIHLTSFKVELGFLGNQTFNLLLKGKLQSENQVQTPIGVIKHHKTTINPLFYFTPLTLPCAAVFNQFHYMVQSQFLLIHPGYLFNEFPFNIGRNSPAQVGKGPSALCIGCNSATRE
ncbi:hypothetical protein GDO86_010655 [Hymenochirus boettgeri]|uniref:Uncharacterized protein n=1 Tax=Hymenochirus boettgeri TaxID=247094 RepID=A0A8T2J8H2_9PIPI|nr:hypothetical protein GDO86_010655 [Hymenochirus boettgeri]